MIINYQYLYILLKSIKNIMVESDKRCVYNGLEYSLTGRYATNKVKGEKVFEIEPADSHGFNDLKIWVKISELYIIDGEMIDD